MASEIKIGYSPFKNLLWLLKIIFAAARSITLVWTLLVLINAGLSAGNLLLLRESVNRLVEGDGVNTAFPWLLALCLAFVGQQVVSLLLPILRERMRIKAGFALQRRVLSKISVLPLESFDDKQTHDVIHRVVSGADVRGTQLMEEGLGIIEFVPLFVTSAVVLGLISIWLPVTLICGVLFMRFLGTRLGKRERQYEVEHTDAQRISDYYAELLTSRQSAAETRLWGISDILLKRWHTTLSGYMSGRLRVTFQNTYQGVLVTLLFTLIFAAALFVVSLSSGRIEAGLAALVIQALLNISTGMNSVQYTMMRFVEHIGYSEDLRYLLEIPISKVASAPTVSYPRLQGEGIIIQNVTYRYPNADTDALRDINLHLHPGEILAIVGENGAGKTTLAQIFSGLRPPTEGQMTIDGIDAATINADDLRKACTFVFQHPARYPATLQDNVLLSMNNDQTPEVESALAQVGLSTDKFPLDTLLGPEFGGIDISGGEWQRVALARSLVKKDAELVIFDEPTAALDPLAELALFEHFVELVDGKTALLIAHRLGPTRLADRVAVLQNGYLVEIGNPSELLQRNGKYAKMFAAQSEWYQ